MSKILKAIEAALSDLYKDEMDEYQQALDQAREALGRANGEVQNLSKQLDETLAANKKLMDSVFVLEAELEDAREQGASLAARIAQRDAQEEAFQKDLKRLTAAVEKLEKERDEKIKFYSDRYDEMEVKYNQSQTEVRNLKAQL